MRKFFCLVLVLALSAGLLLSAAAEQGNEGNPPSKAGTLFLTDEKITFSVVGEQASVYAGSVPAQEVQWQSDNPGVVAVENGVLTARGVGTAKITGCWGDQTVECQAGCLARNREELLRLPQSQLQTPRRIPAKVEFDPTAFFGDAAIIGDSLSANLMVHEIKTNLLGHPLFMARKNIGAFNFVTHRINLYYQGVEYYVEDAVAASGVKKVFFMLGMNDFGYQSPEEFLRNYEEIVDRVLEKSPDVEIYIQTCPPWYQNSTPFSSFNEKIDQCNRLVTEMAAEKGCHVIDLAAYIEDHINSMAKEYTMDYEAHLNYEGSVVWMEVLRAYAYGQLLEEAA